MGMMSRRGFISLAGGAIASVLLAGCGARNSSSDTGAGETAATRAYEVDYGSSDLYTQQDIDAAIEVIMAEFDSWQGCTMQRIAYVGDEASADAVAYANELRADGVAEYDQAIVFSSDFHSPSEEEAEGTAWNPDADYTGWSWFLARTGADGAWDLLTWGYA